MDDDIHTIWEKIDDDTYIMETVFSHKNLEINIYSVDIHGSRKKIKGFSAGSYEKSLMIMLYVKEKYYGYYTSDYISSDLLLVNKIVNYLKNDKVKQLRVYLE